MAESKSDPKALLRAAVRAVDKATVAYSNEQGDIYGRLAEIREQITLIADQGGAR